MNVSVSILPTPSSTHLRIQQQSNQQPKLDSERDIYTRNPRTRHVPALDAMQLGNRRALLMAQVRLPALSLSSLLLPRRLLRRMQIMQLRRRRRMPRLPRRMWVPQYRRTRTRTCAPRAGCHRGRAPASSTRRMRIMQRPIPHTRSRGEAQAGARDLQLRNMQPL